MKRCPNCNRTYTNDQQKFCTKDGTPLVDAQVPGAGQGETVRLGSTELNAAQPDDEPTKVISRELPSEVTAEFDPYKTVMTPPPSTSAALPRDTGELPAPAVSQPLPPSSSDLNKTMPSISFSGASGAFQPPPSGSLPPGASGAIQPPPAASEAHPQAAAPSVSAPLPAQPATPAQQTKKKSRMPLVLGILFLLVLIVIVGGGALYWFVGKPWLESRKEPKSEPTPVATPTRIARATPEPTKEVTKVVPPYSPPPDAVQFVNSEANLSGKLKEHYVDFNFYYPQGWEKDPKAGVPGATNFVQVERSLPPNYTLENFAVGWYSSAGSAEADRTAFPRLAENLSAKFEKTIDNYRKVAESERKVGPYDGYEFRFEGLSQMTDKGQFKIWGVAIFLPPVDGSKNGVTLLMLATSLAEELKSVNDVGVKGQLPMMLRSFRFGK